jgi:hypothetical protein
MERLISSNRSTLLPFFQRGKSFIANHGPQASNVTCTAEHLILDLADGRSLTVPLSWYPRLQQGSPEQRGNWRVAGGGEGIHWPDLDEDLSVEGLLRGAPAPRPAAPVR